MVAESIFAEFDVQPQARDPHGAPIAIVGGIGHVLQIEAREKARDQSRAVVCLRDGLRSVPEPAISDQKIVSAAREIVGVHSGDSRGSELSGRRIEGTMPPPSGDRYANGGQPIDGGEGEALRLAIVPP